MVTPSKDIIEAELQQSFLTYKDALAAWYAANPISPEEYMELADAQAGDTSVLTGVIQTFPYTAATAPTTTAPPPPDVIGDIPTIQTPGGEDYGVDVYEGGFTRTQYQNLEQTRQKMKKNLPQDQYKDWIERHLPRYGIDSSFAAVGPTFRPTKKPRVGDVETGLIYKPVDFVTKIPGGYSVRTEYRSGAHGPPPDFYKERDLINYNVPKSYGVAQIDLSQKRFIGETGTFVPTDKRTWEKEMSSNIMNIYGTGQESRLRSLGLAPSRRMLYAPRQMLTPEEKALAFFGAGVAGVYSLTPWELPATILGMGKELVMDVSERGIIGGSVEFLYDKPRRALMLQPELTGGGLLAIGALGVGAGAARVTSKKLRTTRAKEYKVFEADRFVEVEAGGKVEKVAFGEYKISETAPALKDMILIDRLQSKSIVSDGMYTQTLEKGVTLAKTPKGFKEVVKGKVEFDIIPFPQEQMRVQEFFGKEIKTEASYVKTIKARARLMQEKFLFGKEDLAFARIEALKKIENPIYPDLPSYEFRKLRIVQEGRKLTTPEGMSFTIDTPIKLPEQWKPTIFEPTGKGPKTPLSDTFKPVRKPRTPKPPKPRPVRSSGRTKTLIEEAPRPSRVDLQRSSVALSYEPLYESLSTPPGFKLPGVPLDMAGSRSEVRTIQGMRPMSRTVSKGRMIGGRQMRGTKMRPIQRDKMTLDMGRKMKPESVSLNIQSEMQSDKQVSNQISSILNAQTSASRERISPPSTTKRPARWPMIIDPKPFKPRQMRTTTRRKLRRKTEYTPTLSAWAANIRKKLSRQERKARFTGFEVRPIPLDKPIKRKSRKKTKRRRKK